MNYLETLAYIYGLGRFGIKPGLERIGRLMHELGNPHERLRVVHVAGTNGKGSTASFLAAILSSGGVRAGLYTSPHLVSFTERIRIDGAEISEEAVTRLAARVIEAAPPQTTFFEMVTAMAFLHFAEQDAEVAVMETGMGGRFDATNISRPILQVITPISLDHCEYLGEDIAAIAGEKAGVIKGGAPVVTAAQMPEAMEVIERRCVETGSGCFRFGTDFSALWETGKVSYRGLTVRLSEMMPGISGRYQVGNVACALAAAELLAASGFPLGPAEMRRGVENARWPGRMEFIGEAPRVLLDGAHNPAGCEALAEALADIPHRRILLVTGVMGDKDACGMLAPVLPLADHVYAVAPALERSLPSAELAGMCRRRGVSCTDAGSVAEGLDLAKKAAGKNDLVLVCGSLFTVGEARAFLLHRPVELFRG